MATVPSGTWTSEDLVRLPEGWRYEIDEGELVIMPPAGFEHGEISAAVVTALQTHVSAHHLGVTLTNEPGFRLRRGPDTLRAPDVAFVSNERLSRVADRRKLSDVPPDLAVEVLSPSDANVDMERKVQQYLAAGGRAVWILDPAAATLRRGRHPGELRQVDERRAAPRTLS